MKYSFKAVTVLAVILFNAGLAGAAITTAPVISSSSHPENVSSTNTDIDLSWTAAVSDKTGLKYQYVLDQKSHVALTLFTSEFNGTTTPTLKHGESTGQVVKFQNMVDGMFYFHLLSLDNDGPTKGIMVDYGAITINTTPELSATPVFPNSGSHTTDVTITITGSNFTNPATVQLGSISLANTVDSSTRITATVPKGFTPGNYDLKVTSASKSATAKGAYTSTNQPPVANAGIDQELTLSGGMATLNLDGSASSDVDGDTISSYTWTTITDPSGKLSSTYNGKTQAISLTAAGIYELSLVVNDGFHDSNPDTIKITVKAAAGDNNPPIADAGSNQTVTPGTEVTLNGSQSSDPDSDPLTYLWVLDTKPAASTLNIGTTGNSSISRNTSSIAAFTPDKHGNYAVSLTVNDGTVDSPKATVTITADNAPVAHAGSDSVAIIGSPKSLDASASSDADGDKLAYQWSIISQPTGASISLSSKNIVNPTFTPTVAGSYVFSLTVADGHLSSPADKVTITAGTISLDVDGDGDADANDGVMIQRRLTKAGTVTTGIVLPAGVDNAKVVAAIDAAGLAFDVDGDGDVDANDGVMIQRRLTKAGTVTTGIVLPAGVDNAKVIAAIDALMP